MSSDATASSPVVRLRTLAAVSVVVAAVGLAVVTVRILTRPSGPLTGQSPPVATTARPDAATGGHKTATLHGGGVAPSAAATNRATSVSDPRSTDARASAASSGTRPEATASRATTGPDKPVAPPPQARTGEVVGGIATAEDDAARRAAQPQREPPQLDEPQWDDKTGELVVGRQRFVPTAARVRSLPLNRLQRQALVEFEEVFRGDADERLAQVQAHLAANIAAYHRADAQRDNDGAANYQNEHDRLAADRGAILDALDQKYLEGVREFLPADSLP